MLEETVHNIGQMLMSMDGHLADQIRMQLGLERIVTYFRAAERQQSRVDQWLYDPEIIRTQRTRFPLDQGAALCETHFFFICWDSINKAMENLRQNCYGLKTPREVLKKYRSTLEKNSRARDHLEHLTERLPGQPRTDWRGDSNSLTGTVAGVRRDGSFVFQGEEWDITEASTHLLRSIVSEFVDGVHAEVVARHEAYLKGESAMWAERDRSST